MRCLARAAAVAGLVAALGTSAAFAATSDPTGGAGVTFTSPPSAGATLSQAPVILTGTVDQPGGFVDSITITVTWTDAAKRPPGNHPAQWVTYTPDVRESSVPWNYGPDVPYNGQYTVSVTATTDTGTGSPQRQVSGSEPFVVNLPPATPANVVATPDTSRRITNLTWKANTEPDLIGYQVLRAGPSSSDTGKVVGGVYAPGSSYADTEVASEPAGTYRYELLAVRQSGAGNGAVLSDPSQAADVAFSTPAKPAATTTTSAPSPSKSTTGRTVTTSGGGTSTRSQVVLPPVQAALPDYQALLNEAKSTTVTVPPPDPGFSQRLPYQPQVNSKPITLPAIDSPTVLGGADGGNGVRKTVEFVAAALLLAVLALFALILKRSAEQSAVLEALAPVLVEEPPLGGAVSAMLGRGAREEASWERDRVDAGMDSHLLDSIAWDHPGPRGAELGEGVRSLIATAADPVPGGRHGWRAWWRRRRGSASWSERAAMVSAGLAAEYGRGAVVRPAEPEPEAVVRLPEPQGVVRSEPEAEAVVRQPEPQVDVGVAGRPTVLDAPWEVGEDDWADDPGGDAYEDLPPPLLFTLRGARDEPELELS